MASVELIGVSKSFGAVEVLHDLNLKVEDGEFVALVGPSGCGKSTLLRILAGLDEASSGDIVIDGVWVNELSPKERNIAMVFQSYALYPHMTVEQNIGFNLRISGKSKSEIADQVRRAADILDLTPLMDRKPSQLSGGQRQRVAMGRALVRDPDVFLFDEPLSNLDAKLRVQMREEIKKLHSTVKTTSIYVTHDQIEAMTLADRIVILEGGVIQQVGTPSELYKNPANTFVAGFIGSPSMNIIDATLARDGTQARLSFSDVTLTIPALPDMPADGAVKIGLRPEHLLMAPPVHSQTTLRCTVDMIEPTGAQTHLRVSAGGVSLRSVIPARDDLTIGDTIELSIAPDLIKIFPH